MPNPHAPVLLPLFAVVSTEDFRASYVRWSVLLVLALAVCAWVAYKLSGSVFGAVCMVLFQPIFISITQGNVTPFIWLGVPNAVTAANTYMANTPNANWANSGATTLDKVKFIVLQKYISMAGFAPLEAWSDYRRLGVPANVPLSVFAIVVVIVFQATRAEYCRCHQSEQESYI